MFRSCFTSRWNSSGSQPSLLKCASCQLCQRAMSAWARASFGQSEFGFWLAMYCMIAVDSHSLKSPSTSAGVRPVGLIAR